MPALKPRTKAEPTVTLSDMTAVLENIEQQNRATIEAVQAMENRLCDRFDRRFDAIEHRLAALEFVVRKNSEDIRMERRVKALEERVGIHSVA